MKRRVVVICPVLQKTLQVSDHSGKMQLCIQCDLLICLGRGFKYFKYILLACLGFGFCFTFFFVR